jgi:hypothetical protein
MQQGLDVRHVHVQLMVTVTVTNPLHYYEMFLTHVTSVANNTDTVPVT